MIRKKSEVSVEIEEQAPTEQALMAAPVIIVEGAQGFAANQQQVKVNLYQDLMMAGPGAPAPMKRVICARLVMPTNSFLAIADWLGQRAEDVRKAIAEVEKSSAEK